MGNQDAGQRLMPPPVANRCLCLGERNHIESKRQTSFQDGGRCGALLAAGAAPVSALDGASEQGARTLPEVFTDQVQPRDRGKAIESVDQW